MELGHFDKRFVKKNKKKGLAGKKFLVFPPRYFKKYILNGRFNTSMDTIRAFFQNQGIFFSIFKKGQGRLPTLPPA